jgi:putative glutamine amidotransferase
MTEGGTSAARQPVVAVTMDFDVLRRYHHWRKMLAGFVSAGALPLTIDCRDPRTDLEFLIGMVDGLVLLGGADINPELYGGDAEDPLVQAGPRSLDDNEIVALNAALLREIPVLAVCRGAQLANAALGGTLFADLTRDRPGSGVHRRPEEELDGAAHCVNIVTDTLLAELIGTSGRIPVNSFHHQGIDRLAPEALLTAVADDGLVEAFEITSANLVAVQWHPEISWCNDAYAANLMRGFVQRCADRNPVKCPL